MSDRSSGGAGWRLDLGLVALVVVLAELAILTPDVPRPAVWAVGLPFLLFAPGWAFVSLLLPESPASSAGSPTRAADGPGWIVRLAITFPASVLVVAGVGLVANATVGIRLVPVVVGVGAVTLVALLGAWLRRRGRPADRRATPLGGRAGSAVAALGTTTTQRVVFVLALVVLASAVGLAGTNPPSSEAYSEFYVLTEDDDGDLVAADYPDADSGGSPSLYFAIENEEGQAMSYDVVARTVPTGSGSGAERVDRFQTNVGDGERVIVQRSVPSGAISDGSHLQFLLYKDGVPTDPSPETAAVTLRLGGDGADELATGAGANETNESDGLDGLDDSAGLGVSNESNDSSGLDVSTGSDDSSGLDVSNGFDDGSGLSSTGGAGDSDQSSTGDDGPDSNDGPDGDDGLDGDNGSESGGGLDGDNESESGGVLDGDNESESGGVLDGDNGSESGGVLDGDNESESDGVLDGGNESESDGALDGDNESESDGILDGGNESEGDGILDGDNDSESDDGPGSDESTGGESAGGPPGFNATVGGEE